MPDEFGSINEVMAAVRDCGDILALNIDSMRHVATKTTELSGMIKMRGDDATKMIEGLKRVNGDPGQDGNIVTAVTILELIDTDSAKAMELLNKFAEEVTEILESQRAALEILRNWPS